MSDSGQPPPVHDYLVETYATERLKTLSVWSQVSDADFPFRIEPRARTPHEHMVHQCVSEDTWMRTMLGVDARMPVLPATETRLAFLDHYAAASERRLARLGEHGDAWFARTVRFFDTDRTRAWVLVRRFVHSAHHRGQLTTILRARGRALWSTYGPTADTGGLLQSRAPVIYRYPDVAALLCAEHGGPPSAPSAAALPGPGELLPTERPADGDGIVAPRGAPATRMGQGPDALRRRRARPRSDIADPISGPTQGE